MSSSDNTLAGASDTTGLPSDHRNPDDAVEIQPIVMYGKTDVAEVDANLYDFTPVEEEEIVGLEDIEGGEVTGPKGSSVQSSALSAIYEQVKSPPPVMPQENESSATPETPASADKVSTEDEGNQTGKETGSPTSSS